MMSRGVGVVGYNVQTAVEPEHHLIVAHDVVNTGSVGAHGRAGPRQATHAVADRGDDTGEEILACEQSGITTLVPKAKTSNTGARGLFSRERFRYDSQANAYRWPAGETLTGRFRNVEAGRTLDAYWSSACPRCPLKVQCTPASQRRIRRWEHEAVLEAVQARLDAEPQSMRLRRQTVAHPFGTIKSWMGYTHFLTSSPARSRGCARR
jgi:hypothetical protein